MFAQLENLKKLNTRVVSLLKRRITLLEQIEMAKEEDSAARAKLLDMSLPPEDFTKFSNEARSAQRRRANLEDKLIDLEESVKDVTTEMYSTTDDLFADTQENNFPNSLETTEVELTEADVPADAETTAELDEEEAA
jgi:predicted  nucleic acid-binding Zn-ribbon protein